MTLPYVPRCNDVIAIEATTTLTPFDGPTKHTSRFFLALASRVSRKGAIERYRLPNGPEYILSKHERIMLIGDPDRQSAAYNLLRSPSFENNFPNVQSLRNAIIVQAANANVEVQ